MKKVRPNSADPVQIAPCASLKNSLFWVCTLCSYLYAPIIKIFTESHQYGPCHVKTCFIFSNCEQLRFRSVCIPMQSDQGFPCSHLLKHERIKLMATRSRVTQKDCLTYLRYANNPIGEFVDKLFAA